MAITQNQLETQFQNQLQRPPTDYEIKKFSTASPQTIANLKDTYSKLNTTTSISDYLTSIGQDNSLQARQTLGQKYGISNIGTAEGNTALLKALQGQTAAPKVSGSVVPPEQPQGSDNGQTDSSSGNNNAPTDGTQSNTDNTSNTPPVIPEVETNKTAYVQAQQAVSAIDKQLSDINNAINQAMQNKRDEIARSGGVVDESQLRSTVLTENQPLLAERDNLQTQRQQRVSEQSIAGKAYQDSINQQKESDANFYKSLNYNLATRKQDTQESQFNQKQTQQQQQFSAKLEQSGWKSQKVNTYDEYGNVTGQQLVWTQNPTDKTGFDDNGNIVNVSGNTNATSQNIALINNAGGIKWTGAKWQLDLGMKDSGIKASDGGTFALPPTMAAGDKAQRQLFTSSNYANLTLDAALKRWSNNGYGAEIVPGIKSTIKVKDLTTAQLDQVMAAQKQREGYSGNGGGTSTAGTDVASPTVKMTTTPQVDMSVPGYSTSFVLFDGKNTQLTQAYIDKIAIQAIMNGGTIPSSANRGTKGLPIIQSSAIKERIGQLDPGGSLAQNKALATAWGKALTGQITYASNLDRSLKSSDADLQNIIQTYSNSGINDHSMPIANFLANAGKYGLGSGDVSAFKASLAEISRLYAQVFSTGGSVQGTNITAKDIIDGNISLDNLKKVSDQLQALGKIDVQQAYDAAKNSSTQIGNIVPGGNQNQTPQNVNIGGKSYQVGQIMNDGKYNYSVAPDGLWREDGKHFDLNGKELN